MIDTQQQYIKLNIRSEISIIVVHFKKGGGGGYYNLCGIRSKHSNISKKGGYYNLCGIRSKSWQCYVLSVGF